MREGIKGMRKSMAANPKGCECKKQQAYEHAFKKLYELSQ
jgi:hypothetical protein